LQQLIVLPTCGFDITGNFGSATSKGGELEMRYEPVPSLLLTLGAAYNEAKLTASVAGAQGSIGDTLENAPRWMGSGSAEYRREIGPQTSGFARLDFSSTSYQFNNFDKTSPYYERAGYSLANFRLGAEHGIWKTSLFINNALDKHAETALPLAYGVDLPVTRRLSINQPRTIGVDFRVDW
jgi:iron complex outermembrane receptor protein